MRASVASIRACISHDGLLWWRPRAASGVVGSASAAARRGAHRRLTRSAAALLLALPACSEPTAPARAWPAGTVLAVDDQAITLEEVDDVAGWFAMLEPQFTLPQLRRLALTLQVLPLAAARASEPDRRAAARRQAEEARALLVSGGTPAEPARATREGAWRAIGLRVWRTAIDMPMNTWSEVVESPGAFHVFSITARPPARTPLDTSFTIAAYDFGYLDPSAGQSALAQTIARSRLTFVDESWRDYVPTEMQFRFRGGTP